MALVLGVTALTAVSLLAVSARDSEEQLVRDVLTVRNGPYLRPTHVTASLRGTFGELAEPHLIALELSRKRIGTETAEQVELRRAVERGQKPSSTLRPEWKQELAGTQEALDGLLRATHGAGARPPYLLSIFGAFGPDDDRYGGSTPQYAAKLAALRIRAELEAGDTRAAAQTCVDALGMARDVAYSSIMGQMIAHSMLKLVEPACRDTARAASAAEQGTLKSALALVIAGWPKLRDTLYTEMVFGQLALFFDQLSDATKSELPADAHLRGSPRKGPGWLGHVQRQMFGAWARRTHIDQMYQLMEAVQLPPARADSEIERIASKDFPYTLAGMDDDPKSSWVPLLRRTRTTIAYLVRLEAVVKLVSFHSAQGRWPTDWQETNFSQPIDPRTNLPFSLRSAPAAIVFSAKTDGERLGVQVKTGVMVKDIDREGVTFAGPNGQERLDARTVIWAGGVTVPAFAAVLAKRIHAETDRSGRIKVSPYLTVPNYPDIYVIGDLALASGVNGKPLPGVAQVAMQQGTYAGKAIASRMGAEKALPPVKYLDKGNLAVIGRASAVANVFGLHLSGLPAWLVWALIHLTYLVQFQSRVLVSSNGQSRISRLIVVRA